MKAVVISLNLSKANGFVVKVLTTRSHYYNHFILLHFLLPIPLFFLPILRLPPSLPNRNSLKRRFRGNLFGKISSFVTVGVAVTPEFTVEGLDDDKLEIEEECDPEPEPEPDTAEFRKFPVGLLLTAVGPVVIVLPDLLAE